MIILFSFFKGKFETELVDFPFLKKRIKKKKNWKSANISENYYFSSKGIKNDPIISSWGEV